jgi:signal transduction histidine kinase
MGNCVQIAVHNRGAAIPEASRRVLFDPFRRGREDEGTPRTSGLGLGLYISSEIVIAHGGSIDFVSTDAEGTTFRVLLPRAAGTSHGLV